MPIPLNPNPILPLQCDLARITLQVSHRACLSRRANIRLGYPSVSERIRVVELAKLRLPRALGAEPRRTARRGGARDSLVVRAEDAAKGGLHNGQAGVDHAERGLKVGPDGQLGEVVGEVQHVELDGRDDAEDGDDADTVSSRDLCVRNQSENIEINGLWRGDETGRLDVHGAEAENAAEGDLALRGHLQAPEDRHWQNDDGEVDAGVDDADADDRLDRVAAGAGEEGLPAFGEGSADEELAQDQAQHEAGYHDHHGVR